MLDGLHGDARAAGDNTRNFELLISNNVGDSGVMLSKFDPF
jgi:hypothetical protein